MTRITLEEELQKKRMPPLVMEKLREQMISSITELALRSDLVQYFESELKPVQWSKLKTMIKESQAAPVPPMDKELNYGGNSSEDGDIGEAVLIDSEMKATKEQLVEQFKNECEQLKAVIDLILDDVSCIDERAKSKLEKSKASHQNRANRLQQLLRDVHKCTPDATRGESDQHPPASIADLTARKIAMFENDWRVRFTEKPDFIEPSFPTPIVERKASSSVSEPPERKIESKLGGIGYLWSNINQFIWGTTGSAQSTAAPPAYPQRGDNSQSNAKANKLQEKFQARSQAKAQAKAEERAVASRFFSPAKRRATAPETAEERRDVPEDPPIEPPFATSDVSSHYLTMELVCAGSARETQQDTDTGAVRGTGHSDQTCAPPTAAPTSPTDGELADLSTAPPPSAQQYLQELTAETDKFSIAMGPTEPTEPAGHRSASHLLGAAAIVVPTAPPVSQATLHQAACILYSHFHELQRELVGLCSQVNEYNCRWTWSGKTRKDLLFQYARLHKDVFSANRSAQFSYNERKEALDARRGTLFNIEASLTVLWDLVHQRCKQWNETVQQYNYCLEVVKADCLRCRTGLTLVGDISPLPVVNLCCSLAEPFTGLYLNVGPDRNHYLVHPVDTTCCKDYLQIVKHCVEVQGSWY